MTLIIPAILATNEEEYVSKLQKIESESELSRGWVQIDLMDNKFVQNQSVGCDIIAKYPIQFKIEAQLMVEYPEGWIDELVKIPQVRRIIFPVEDNPDIMERINHIKAHQRQVGLSINPQTEVSMLDPYADFLDCVLVMSVEPGFGGQKFIVQSIDRVREIKERYAGIRVGVDGGVNVRYIAPLVEAGIDYLVIGSHLMEGDIDENLQKIKDAL